MPTRRYPVRFLASVTSPAEAVLAAACGADIVDAKNPHDGALGALPLDVVRAIRRALSATMLSATTGDGVPDGAGWAHQARRLADAGVDVVKIGVFPGADAAPALMEVGRVDLGCARLVGVMLADRPWDLGLVEKMAQAGFLGVMLDTAGKAGGALTDAAAPAALAAFIAEARRHGLLAGLAGSLGLPHIAPLAALAPDILGFRGALCRGGRRTEALDPARVRAVRDALRSVDPRSGREDSMMSLHLASLEMTRE